MKIAAIPILIIFGICSNHSLGQQIPVILDTDANSELDDQHAIAYTLFNNDIFDIKGITVNATDKLGKHFEEAVRVVQLCGYSSSIRVIDGVQGSYVKILPDITNPKHDGYEAVDFMIEQAHANQNGKLVLIPIGKLTNVALALTKDPTIASKVRIVWLGSNWPEPGEYNLVNDLTSVNPIIDMDVDFEICVVRYGKLSGTDAVKVSIPQMQRTMPGLGPKIASPIPGRSGGEFDNFGDYSVNLFEKMGDEYRSLFDVCAVAVIKNTDWAQSRSVGGVYMKGKDWITSDNKRTVVIWENFDKDAILADFFEAMKNPVLNNR